MRFSVLEVQEARAQIARVDDDSLIVGLVDGRTIIVPLVWFHVCGMGLPRNELILCCSATAHCSTGPTSMKTSVFPESWPGGNQERVKSR